MQILARVHHHVGRLPLCQALPLADDVIGRCGLVMDVLCQCGISRHGKFPESDMRRPADALSSFGHFNSASFAFFLVPASAATADSGAGAYAPALTEFTKYIVDEQVVVTHLDDGHDDIGRTERRHLKLLN